MRLHQCPRCTWECFEKLKTHSYCINCNYFEVRKARLPRVSTMPPLPAAPARVLELTVIDNDELITDFAHDISQKKKIA
jgi:hypothetical protein